MKNSVMLILTLSLFVAGNIHAQRRMTTVTGQIVEQGTRTPIEAAAVRLLALPDSSLAAGKITDKNGCFSLPQVKPGNYLLKVSFIGYTTLYHPVKLTDKSPAKHNLGVFRLATDATMLAEAVITAEAPPVTVNADTTEYNASAYRVAEGDMVEELIKQLPGVEVDENGKITLNGEEIKKIMVNGKEFFGNNTEMSMKNLPADAIKKLKAYKEMSDHERLTGIKDGNETAVLDLTLKKNSGWMGNLNGGYGTKERYEGNANVNHFTDDMNLSFIGNANNTRRSGRGERTQQNGGVTYARKSKTLDIRGNVRYNHSVSNTQTQTDAETFLGDESTYSNRLSDSRNGSHNLNGDAMVEWKVDSLNTLNANISMSYNKGDSWSENWRKNSDNDLNAVNETSSSSYGDNHSRNINGRLSFYHRFRKPGRNFHVSFNFSNSNSESDRYSRSYSQFFLQDSISDIERNTRSTGNNQSWALSAGYIEPLSKHYRLSVDYSFHYRTGLSQSLAYDSINYPDRTNYGYNDQLSSKVENNYGNHDIGLSLQGDYRQWEPERKGLVYNVGVTLNPYANESHTTIGPNTGKDLPKQHALNWSPRITADYYFSRHERINIRYSGRSSAPGLQDLQEVISVTDPMNLRYGNPNLKPSFSNNVRIDYNRYSAQTMRSFHADASFNNTLNAIGDRMTYDKGTGARTYHKTNLNGNWNTGTNISFDTPLKNKKFTIGTGASTNYSNQVRYLSVGGKDSELSTTHSFSTNERVRASYRSDDFDITLNGRFRYNKVSNDKQPGSNRETFDYTLSGNTHIRLPWDIEVSTDLSWHIREGYSGNAGRDELLWNAQISKRFLKGKKATVRLRMFDILQQQNNQTRSVRADGITDTTSNMLTSYCILSFSYRFNTLTGGEGRHRRAR